MTDFPGFGLKFSISGLVALYGYADEWDTWNEYHFAFFEVIKAIRDFLGLPWSEDLELRVRARIHTWFVEQIELGHLFQLNGKWRYV